MKEMVYRETDETEQDPMKPEVLDRGCYKGLEYIIGSLQFYPVAYIHLPKDHKFVNKNYDDINDIVGSSIPRPLTYANNENNENIVLSTLDQTWVENQYWVGWAYNESFDYSIYTSKHWEKLFGEPLKRWTTKEILEDVKKTIDILIQVE